MTIVTSAARASALSTAGLSNNPFITPAPLTGTYITAAGTEVLAAANAYSGTTFDPWVATPGALDFAIWQVVFGSSVSPTFAGIAAHNLSDIGATVRIEYSIDSGATWTDSGAGPVTPTDNQAIGFRFQGISADYWRVTCSNCTDDASIAVIWLGQEVIIPQRIYQGYTPPITPTQVDLNTNVSEGANTLGTAFVERGSMWEASLRNIEPTFIRGASWRGFQQRWNRGFGAFWAWRPTKYGDLYWSWRSQGMAPITPTNSGPKDYMSFDVSARAYHDD